MMMPREELMQQQGHRLEAFAQAAFHVRQGHAVVARQRALVDRLERDGRDAASARVLLKQFSGSLEIFEEDYSRLKGELEHAG
jgi:hypothetical protein